MCEFDFYLSIVEYGMEYATKQHTHDFVKSGWFWGKNLNELAV